jgi:hypothetical protein
MLGSYRRVFDDNDVLKLLRSGVRSAGGQTAFAKATGLDRSYLNTVLSGKRRLGPSILSALNLRIVYAPITPRSAEHRRGVQGRGRWYYALPPKK